MDFRKTLQQLAQSATNDPAHASAYARAVLDQVTAWRAAGGAEAPPGYLYAGARTLIARAERLEVEPTRDESAAFGGNPKAVEIFKTGNPAIEIEVPTDVLIYGVAGFCRPNATFEDDELLLTGTEAAFFSGAQDCRDFFAARWGLNGEKKYVTDGTDAEIVVPAACLVGTRQRPRALAWAVQRNSTIGVTLKNIWNYAFPRDEEILPVSPTLNCGIVFYAMNLERLP